MADRDRQPPSLTLRVLIVASLWAVIALLAIAILISTLYRNGAERGFRDVLRAQLYNLINSISISDTGRLRGMPQLGDLRFSQPGSGWYWIVEVNEAGRARQLASVSLGNRTVAVANAAEIPFDELYERVYPSTDSDGNRVVVSETEILLGDGGEIARFRIIGNAADVDRDVSAFSRQLFVFLALFGIGSLMVNAVAILFGLRPLDRIRRSLEEIRAGRAESLRGRFPREIAPLTGEVNALIESNRRIVERARMQVGNLAHSLKTPIAVLLNEARQMAPGQARLVEEQASAMQVQVQHYLDRARIAAQQNSILVRCETGPVLERLVRVMQRLKPDIDFELEIPDDTPDLAMEQHDVEEMLGNVLENAGKWARDRVCVRVDTTVPGLVKPMPGASRGWLCLSVEDNGPGMAEDQLDDALKRGRRLDESKPGTGLGLSIIKEIAAEYDGAVQLDRAPLGGLRVRLTLPVALR